MGFLVGLLNSITVAFQNSQLRQLSGVSTYLLNWLRFLVATVILAILVTVFSRWHIPPRPFWLLLLGVSLPIEILIAFGYARAFQVSPQSLVGPLFSLSPIFLVPMSYLLNGELPSRLGLVGVFSAAVGALALGWDMANPGIRRAVANILGERGSYFMLGAAFFAAIAVSVAKFSYRYSSPLLFAFYITAALLIAHTPAVFTKSFSQLRGRWRGAIAMASAYGVGMALHYTGLSLLIAAYYISIKRLSIVFDVIFGKIIGREDHLRERLAGALLMVAGVILIALG